MVTLAPRRLRNVAAISCPRAVFSLMTWVGKSYSLGGLGGLKRKALIREDETTIVA